MLEMIDHLCGGKSPPQSMLDVGTGSGILAIAAARLGVERVVGVDMVADTYLACGAREIVRDGDGAWSVFMFEVGRKTSNIER